MHELVYPLDFRAAPSPDGLGTEWLFPNGLGGFAMGTALGTPTRRYHGLLIAALSPPVERVNLVTQVVERLVLAEGRELWLTPLHFHDAPRPRSCELLTRFEKGPNWCQWIWSLPVGGQLHKRLELARACNAARLFYHIVSPSQAGTLELIPLLSLRDFHALSRRSLHAFHTRAADGNLVVSTRDAGVRIEHEGLERIGQAELWRQFFFEREADRGQDCLEDLCAPARYRITFAAGCESTCALRFQAQAEPSVAPAAFDPPAVVGLERALAGVEPDDGQARLAIMRLTEAAGSFVVARSGQSGTGVTILAGYPWFADWGRDTMISLPGLLLCTGRYDQALSTLELFGRHIRRGLIPNRFDDYAQGAHYNTVDASLWFLHAATEYRLVTGDAEGFARLVGPCLEIVEAYRDGTDYEIHLDDDGLVCAGTPETQLTWMDAQRDGVTFTPRFGKCVEINALWHHGLRRLAALVGPHAPASPDRLDRLAERCADSFARFVCPPGGLYDRLEPTADGWEPVAEIRPNQIFAASLAASPLDREHRAEVVATVRRHLLTPFGLRTLAPGQPGYRGRYAGNLFERDAAYHNGTVWPWLMGPYIEAAWRLDSSRSARRQLRAWLVPLTERMQTTCLGQVSEICQGDPPHEPDGCPAQAWSVAELLRAWIMLASSDTASHRR